MKCASCGAEIQNSKFCEFCGSQITQEMQREQEQLIRKGCPKCGSSNISFRRENQGEIRGINAKQVVHRTIGVCKDCGNTWFADGGATAPQRKRKTWLWVLGWFFIFPIPLTIIMLRKKDMNSVLKYGIIAVTWIVYLIIGFSGTMESNAELYEKVMAEKRIPIDYQYLQKDFDNNEDSINTFIDSNKNSFIRWTAHVTKVGSSDELTLQEEGFPKIKADFVYSWSDSKVIRKGDVVTITGNLVKFHKGFFTSYWELENCRIEATTPDEKHLVENYKLILFTTTTSSPSASITVTSTQTTQTTINITTTPTTGTTSQTESTSTQDTSMFIPGLDTGYIKTTFREKLGLEFEPLIINKLEGGYLDVGTTTVLTDNELYNIDCEIFSANSLAVYEVWFKIQGEEFNSSTGKGILSFAAQLPYDSNDPSQASDWIKSQYDSLKKGQEVSTTIGGVTFTLIHSDLEFAQYRLKIYKKQFAK